MAFLVTLIVLSILGALNAGYLAYEHFRRRPLMCPLDHDCSAITESRWAHVLGIRNEVLGLLFYATLLAGSVGAVLFPAYAPALFFLVMLASILAFAFSAFLVGIQLFVIKDYCFYCLISAFINLLVLLNAFYLVFV